MTCHFGRTVAQFDRTNGLRRSGVGREGLYPFVWGRENSMKLKRLRVHLTQTKGDNLR